MTEQQMGGMPSNDLESKNKRLEIENAELKDRVRYLEEMIASDELVRDALNRSFLDQILKGYLQQLNGEEEVEAENRSTESQKIESLIVIYIDLDEFSSVNNIYGHPIGDKALIEVGKRMKAATRRGDSIFRVGGDEFMIVMPMYTTSADFQDRFDEIKKKLGEDLFIEGERLQGSKGMEKIPLSLSMGFIPVMKGDITAEEIIKQADARMYEAKNGGRKKEENTDQLSLDL